MYARTAYPSTEERQQLARDLEMSVRSVQIWLAHAFVTNICLNSLRFKNKRQASRQGLQNLPNRPISQVNVTPHPPVFAILAFLAFLAILVVAFVVARNGRGQGQRMTWAEKGIFPTEAEG